MVQKTRSEGICVTCIHLARCLSFQKNRKNDVRVLQCEEFEIGGVADGAKTSFLQSGICVNCDDHGGCQFRRPNQNIHFCEEYASGTARARPTRCFHEHFLGFPNFGIKTFFPGWKS